MSLELRLNARAEPGVLLLLLFFYFSGMFLKSLNILFHSALYYGIILSYMKYKLWQDFIALKK